MFTGKNIKSNMVTLSDYQIHVKYCCICFITITKLTMVNKLVNDVMSVVLKLSESILESNIIHYTIARVTPFSFIAATWTYPNIDLNQLTLGSLKVASDKMYF